MSLGEINLSYVLQASMAPELTFLEEGLAVTTPRQLLSQVQESKLDFFPEKQAPKNLMIKYKE